MKKASKIIILIGCVFVFPFSLVAKKSENPRADRIVIEKEARRMTLYHGKDTLKVYSVSLGKDPIGAKQKQGDHKTPEGHYVIDWRNPNSAYHRSLHISYPSSSDSENAKARGVTPGGYIMIHGLPNGMPDLGPLQSFADWTDGCVAVSNSEMDEIWDLVADGTPVDILP